jgi:hypothetical protein
MKTIKDLVEASLPIVIPIACALGIIAGGILMFKLLVYSNMDQDIGAGVSEAVAWLCFITCSFGFYNLFTDDPSE